LPQPETVAPAKASAQTPATSRADLPITDPPTLFAATLCERSHIFFSHQEKNMKNL
jgi:hypothetical protein